jgi:Domain of unknown function (DUF4157)
MSMMVQVQAKSAPTHSFTPAPSNLLQRKCACGGTPGLDGECAECRQKRLSRQRRFTNQAESAMVPSIVHKVVRSPGQPLDAATRVFMEPRFDHDFRLMPASTSRVQPSQLTISSPDDTFEREAETVAAQVLSRETTSEGGQRADFSRVEIHAGSQAAAAAQAVNARAFTVGRHIVFGMGEYQPRTTEGRKLLAHELSHVMQQSALTSGDGERIVQRTVSRGAGGCGPATEVDEDNSGARGAGSAAHAQIQSFLLPGVLSELQIPRATKALLGDVGCQPDGTSEGRADLWRRRSGMHQLGEIKPFGFARGFGIPQAEHYILRAEQSMDRFFGSGAQCGSMPRGDDDQAFAHRIGTRRIRPAFGKIEGILTNTTVVGPFDGDRSRTLKAQLVAPGAVGYWCTGGQSDTYTCGVSEQETREFIDRVALGPAQETLNRFIQEQVERPLEEALERASIRELLQLGERHFGSQVRGMLSPFLGPAAGALINQTSAERLAELIEREAGPVARSITMTLLRRLKSKLINELRVQLRNVLAATVRDALLALCVGAPVVTLVHLLKQVELELRRRTRQLIPVIVTAVVTSLAAELAAALQEMLASMAAAIGRALGAVGRVLQAVGEILLRVLAAIAILLLIVAAIVVAVLAFIAIFDPVPGDEAALTAASLALLALIPALGRYVLRGSTQEQPDGGT